ncbi:MAG TPA: DUF2892 domain-containing protein [Gemmatimonadaceae bacterium]|nr:DUF2892 domain-containing protein [Gemmatimonadaceae bacterium]
MRKNIGPMDRAVRIIAGMILVSLTMVGPQTTWGFLGLIPLVTAFVGWCPLYALLGIDTMPRGAALP